ncbi:MAG: sulfotransferase [Anaerolineae bacterium]|nr:sulfotransferase [Anaerolineae bacterium]
MIYVILGMHKSGTTLVSQMLHHSGINMVDDLAAGVSYDQGNKYERQSAKSLNEAILDCSGVESIDVAVPDTLYLTDEHRSRMQAIIQQSTEKYGTWGFKDPRTSLIYPLWASELPEHKLIVVYRSPEELWMRYRADHLRNRYRDPYKAWRFMNRWCEHNAAIVDYLRQTRMEFIVLDYRRLVSTSAEFNRLRDFVGQELSDQRKIELYRHQPGQKPFLLKMIDGLIDRNYGYRSDRIIEQLEAFKNGDQSGKTAINTGLPQTVGSR